MEERFLEWIHSGGGPVLDALFLASHQLGTLEFCAVLVIVAALWSLWRRRRIEALAWVALGLSTWALQEGIKLAVARPRPSFWTGPIVHTSYAFPSGHAVAAATFYPFLAWVVARRWPAWKNVAYVAAFSTALFVGFGRLYLGVHWPSDVLAGWLIGAGQTFVAIRMVHRFERPGLQPHPERGETAG
jgi:undecaprenyl-diphosphatase